MLQTLRQPNWIVATVIVIILAAVFVGLGVWQLDRLEQRQALNEQGKSRLSQEPVSLAGLLDEADGNLASIQYRPVHISGSFDQSGEVLIRSQVELGQAGFHVLTPFVADDGSAVLVNRGWVPLNMDTPPVDAPPLTGSTSLEGWIQLTQTRPALGREDPPGDQDVLSRVDVERIGEQVPYDLAPVYVVAVGESGTELPVTVDPPDFSDERSHLAYALQWFSFAAIGLIGFFFLMRRKDAPPANQHR